MAPVSVAYSLQSQDHARIRAITELIDPDAVFAEDAERFGPALDALGLKNRSALIELLYADPPPAHVIIPGRAH